jgi:hypothetical protein
MPKSRNRKRGKAPKRDPHTAEHATWLAMKKFADDEPLTEQEWEDLSWLTLVDRTKLLFGPGNVRWATSHAERADNIAFYRSLGQAAVR